MVRKFRLFPGTVLERLVNSNRLDEVNFLPSFFEQKEVHALRRALELPENDVKLRLNDFKTDIFTLGGQIARMLAQGGPYSKMNEAEAWNLGMRLAEEEFGNRFTDVLFYSVVLPEAKWFDGIAWDYCFLLLDKQKTEITFIATTGSD